MAKMHILFFKLSINLTLNTFLKHFFLYFTCILYLQLRVGERDRGRILSVGKTGVGKMGVGKTGQIIGETGVGETGVGETGVGEMGVIRENTVK